LPNYWRSRSGSGKNKQTNKQTNKQKNKQKQRKQRDRQIGLIVVGDHNHMVQKYIFYLAGFELTTSELARRCHTDWAT